MIKSWPTSCNLRSDRQWAGTWPIKPIESEKGANFSSSCDLGKEEKDFFNHSRPRRG